jgi:hypothetical protein
MECSPQAENDGARPDLKVNAVGRGRAACGGVGSARRRRFCAGARTRGGARSRGSAFYWGAARGVLGAHAKGTGGGAAGQRGPGLWLRGLRWAPMGFAGPAAGPVRIWVGPSRSAQLDMIVFFSEFISSAKNNSRKICKLF